MAENADTFEDCLKNLIGLDLISLTAGGDCYTAHIYPENILHTLTLLKTNPRFAFTQLVDICGVDYPERPHRFEVVYHLLSHTTNQRLRLKVTTDEHTPVPSIHQVFSCATWYEREVYDLFGIHFSHHPDLRRILTDYGFEGHPLRKDFPLTGHVEVIYDATQRRVVYQPVTLTQDFRAFDNLSPWEGILNPANTPQAPTPQEQP